MCLGDDAGMTVKEAAKKSSGGFKRAFECTTDYSKDFGTGVMGDQREDTQ